MAADALGQPRGLVRAAAASTCTAPSSFAPVEAHAAEIAAALDAAAEIPVRIVGKPVATTPESIRAVLVEANASPSCIGVIAWMHTFSPAKMWISGLTALQRPFLHLHTQYNRDLPWAEIDMDFMNLNQSAHGDREFAFMETRMGLRRKTVVGHWRDPGVRERIGVWARAAAGWHEAQPLTVARFGDNMRQVAVTEGDKVEAQIRLGVAVSGYGVGDLVESVERGLRCARSTGSSRSTRRTTTSRRLRAGGERRESLRDAARIEAGLREFLERLGVRAFTDTFEDLDGLKQLPGHRRPAADGRRLRVRRRRRLEDGRARPHREGDEHRPGRRHVVHGGLHLRPGAVRPEGARRAHARGLPSIAAERPSCEIHPLSIGGRDDPVRLVFTAAPGPAVVARCSTSATASGSC